MSSQSSPQTHEPTMEEILASIRKIISEDQAEPAQAAAPAAAPSVRPVPMATPAPAPVQAAAPMPMATEIEGDGGDDEDAEILELTLEVQEAPEPEPAPQVQAAAPEASEYSTGSSGEAEAAEYDAAATQDEAGESDMASEGLISDSARRAMSQAFQPLESAPAASAPANASAPGMTSLQGSQLEAMFSQAIHQAVQPAVQDWVGKNSGNMVQHMKPIIREWMDQNLPELIEKAVKSEIAAAVRSMTQRR